MWCHNKLAQVCLCVLISKMEIAKLSCCTFRAFVSYFAMNDTHTHTSVVARRHQTKTLNLYLLHNEINWRKKTYVFPQVNCIRCVVRISSSFRRCKSESQTTAASTDTPSTSDEKNECKMLNETKNINRRRGIRTRITIYWARRLRSPHVSLHFALSKFNFDHVSVWVVDFADVSIDIWFRRRFVYWRVASTRRIDSERLIAMIGIYYVRHSHARCRRELATSPYQWPCEQFNRI